MSSSTTIPEMHVRMAKGAIPPFYEIGALPFQDMCRDLYAEQPGIATCDVYGKSGEKQYGIDLIAPRRGTDGTDVGQCKCYKTFSPQDIEKASDEFLEHWDKRWSKEQIRRFILFVACDLSSIHQQNEIIKQRSRFAEYGVEYDVWSAVQIRQKLTPHQAIVARYCHPVETWVREICGNVASATPAAVLTNTATSGIVSGLLAAQLEAAAAELSESTAHDLERMYAAYRVGQRQDVARWPVELRHSPRWQLLANDVKAKVLRFEALLALIDANDTQRATELADEAQQVFPGANDRRLRALIAADVHGPAAGLALIEEEEDVDSVNLRAALLLQLGDIDACCHLICSEDKGLTPDTETLRLRSLVFLLRKEIHQADAAIQQAQELASDWLVIRLTAATLDYYCALSTPALPDVLVAWPEPVDWSLVKRDDTSLARLRRASEIFGELATMAQSDEDRRNAQAWRLACLANDPDRQAEAASYCESLLRSDPTEYRAIAWAVGRSLGIDLDPSEQRLNQMITKKQAETPHVLALVSCYLATGRAKKALALLDRTRPLFLRRGLSTAWDALQMQCQILAGGRKARAQAIESKATDNAAHAARTAALEQESRKTGDFRALLEHLDRSYDETHDAFWLLASCEVLARHQQWSTLAARAVKLVNTVGTAAALQLAVAGMFNAKQYEPCLTLLEEHRALFPEGRLPRDLRRIRIDCQRSLGILSDAVAAAEELVREEPSIDNLLMLAQIHIEKGDLRSLALTARELNGREELTATQALRLGQVIAPHDRQLATALWQQAIAQPLADDEVGPVVDLGFQLGRDRELGPLMGRMQELAEQCTGGVRLVSLDELAEWMAQHRSRAPELERAYRAGTAPLHVIAEIARRPLAAIYHEAFVRSARSPDPYQQLTILARHGGRAKVTDVVQRADHIRLHIDVTSIMIAAHLGILDALEQSCAPLRIPSELIPALLQMQSTVSTHQPSRVQAARDVLRLVDRGSLHVLDGAGADGDQAMPELEPDLSRLLAEARRRNGLVVDYLPIREHDSLTPVPLPPDVEPRIVNCRALIDALRAHGPLSQEDHARAVEALGQEGIARTTVRPTPGSVLICSDSIPGTLASADVLETVCARFQVWIDPAEHKRCRALIEEDERRGDLLGWLGTLIEQLRDGLDSGVYQLIPVQPRVGRIDEGTHSHELQCLGTLLEYPVEAGDFLWIDDRCVNAHPQRGGALIVDVTDVLHLLVARGVLTQEQLYERLLALRAANVRHIPLDAAEIAYHLGEAEVADGAVVETTALQVLRRYLAAGLLRHELLQRPPLPDTMPNPHGELTFLHASRGAIVEALRQVWRSAPDGALRLARADWIYNNLFLDNLDLAHFRSANLAIEELRFVVSLGLSELLIPLPNDTMPGGAQSEDNPTYADWVNDRVLAPRFSADPLMSAAVAERIKVLFADLLAHDWERDVVPIVVARLGITFQGLPALVQQQLQCDTEFMERLGYRLTRVIQVGGYRFDQEGFVAAAAEAVNGRTATLKDLRSEQPVLVRPCADERGEGGVVCIEDALRSHVTGIANQALLLLLSSIVERESVLARNLNWFDRPSEVVKAAIAEIATMEDPQGRIDAVASWQLASAAYFYEQLHHHMLTEREQTYAGFLPPHASSLLWHLGIDPEREDGPAFAGVLAHAAESLLADQGLEVAIDRLAGLPVPLPSVLVDTLTAMPAVDQRSVMKRLLRISGSPLSMLHCINLLLRLEDTIPAAGRLARRMSVKLLGEDAQENLAGFLVLLRWVEDELSARADVRQWSASRRLAVVWSHTHRLFCIFTAIGLVRGEIRRMFGSHQRNISPEFFDRNRAYWLDATHPRHVSATTFLVDGLAFALERALPLGEGVAREQLMRHIFVQGDEWSFPDPRLLVEPPSHDSLGSFLSGRRATKLTHMLSVKDAEVFSHEAAQDALEEALTTLSTSPDDKTAWMVLDLLLGDFPPPARFVERLRMVLQATDYAQLIAVNRETALRAMLTASRQAEVLGDAMLRSYVEDMIGMMARMFAQQAELQHVSSDALGVDATNEILVTLVQAAQNVSLSDDNVSTGISTFAALLIRICDAWPASISFLKRVTQRLWEELPLEQAQHLWSLLLRTRAG